MTRKLGAFKTSKLQDAKAGRSLELDQLEGAPLGIAGRLHLPGRQIETLFVLVRVFAQGQVARESGGAGEVVGSALITAP